MLTTRDIALRLKSVTDTGSDYAAAKLLGVTRQAFSRYVNGGNTMSDEVGLNAAEILQIEADYVLACLSAERAQGTPTARLWAHLAQRLTPETWRATA